MSSTILHFNYSCWCSCSNQLIENQPFHHETRITFHLTLDEVNIKLHWIKCNGWKSPVGCGKGRKFESWTFSRKVVKTNCTKLTLKEEDSSLNNSRTLRSYCVLKFITHPPSNTQSLISLNATQCKYSEVWCDCVSTLYGTASEFSLTQRLPWLLWQLWLWLFIFWNAHCVKSHFQHSMAGLSCFLKFVCLTLTSVTLLYIFEGQPSSSPSLK